MAEYNLSYTGDQISTLLTKAQTDISTHELQDLSSTQQSIARGNIEAADGDLANAFFDALVDKDQGIDHSGEIVVADTSGRITTVNKSLIFDNDVYTPEYLKDLIRVNAHTTIPIGEQYSINRMTNVTVSASTGTVTIDKGAFIQAIGEAEAKAYEFEFDGSNWKNSAEEIVNLVDYGINYVGTAVSGTKILVTVSVEEVLFDLVDYNSCCEEGEKSLVFLSHYVLNYSYWYFCFSEPQLLIASLVDLQPGNYKFKIDHGAYNGTTNQDGIYMFTTTVTIPAGGGLRHSTVGLNQSSYNTTQITNGTITTYGVAPTRTVLESGITVSQWDNITECIDLGTTTSVNAAYLVSKSGLTKVNFSNRNAFGSNRYSHSNVYKWLNSDGKTVGSGDSTFSYWWYPSNEFDMPPSDANFRKREGFLYGLDPRFVNAISEPTTVVEMPSPERSLGSDNTEILHDKFFLPSKTEIEGGTNISQAEGTRFIYYTGVTNFVKRRINNTGQYYERSATPNLSQMIRGITTTGVYGNQNANGKSGMVPCFILKA